jgi:hypothetical protein
MLTSCYYESKVHAKDYNFEKLYKKPKPGKLVSKFLFPYSHLYYSVYEDSLKHKRLNPIYIENYGFNNYKTQIMYFYKEMVKQDGIFSDNELFPIIVNQRNGRIIGSGWAHADSLKQINYLKRN